MKKSNVLIITILMIALNLDAASECNNKPALSTYQLTVITKGCTGQVTSIPTGIACGRDTHCTFSFEAGSSVTLSAEPYVGCKFTGWENIGTVGQTLTILMDTNKTVIAYFDIWDDDHDGHPNVMDCDDQNPSIHTLNDVYIDVDGDHYDAGMTSICHVDKIPTGSLITSNGNVSQNTTTSIFPPLPSGYSYYSLGKDCDDLDVSITALKIIYVDRDGDGYNVGSMHFPCTNSNPPPGYSYKTLGTDCDDMDASITVGTTFYIDSDGDGYSVGSILFQCKVLPGYSSNSLGNDCDDSNPSIYQPVLWYLDQDGDGYAGNVVMSCIAPGAGYTKVRIPEYDCNDLDSSIKPKFYFLDTDHDGYGGTDYEYFCSDSVLTGYSLKSGDCNDRNPSVHNNLLYYRDADKDGFGNSLDAVTLCSENAPDGFVRNNVDCDDSRLLYADNDHDGYGAGSPIACGVEKTGDCNDENAAIHPGSSDICNKKDDDCDRFIDEDCRESPLYISRDSVLPPSDPTIIITHGLININIQTMQHVNIKVSDSGQYGEELKGNRYYDSQPNNKLYRPIDTAYLTITLPANSNNRNDESIKIEIFDATRGQNNNQFSARKKE